MHEGTLINKRVVFLFPSLQLGGAERQGLSFARYLKRHTGAYVEIWSLNDGDRVAELCQAEGIPVRVIAFQMWTSRFELLRHLLRFAMVLRRSRVDVLLPYVMQPNLICGATWRLGGVQHCVWQQRDEGRNRGPRLLERLALWQIRCFVANSTPGVDFLRDELGVPASRIHFIRNGVDIPRPIADSREWRSRLEVNHSTFLACMVANITTAKDHDTLLRAWRLVLDYTLERGESIVLLLAGRHGDAEFSAKALAYDLDLGRSVRFLGAVDDVSGLLEACDLCVFSSRTEGCPNGVLEAMSCGKPVVATDIPGIRDAVGDDGLEFLSPPGDVPAMARLILQQMNQPESRVKQGVRNRERTQTEFSPQRMFLETFELLANGGLQ